MYEIGTTVEWSWGGNAATGKVAERFTETVTRTIDGTEVKRNADDGNPAYLIEQENGSRALKSHSELTGRG